MDLENESSASMVHGAVLAGVATVLERSAEDVDAKESFVGAGGCSIRAISLSSLCARRGIHLPVATILTAPTVHDLVEAAVARPLLAITERTPPSSSTDSGSDGFSRMGRTRTRTSEDPRPSRKRRLVATRRAPMTEMQFAFLHGSEKNAAANIIHYKEEHALCDLPQLRHAWQMIVQQEPIFRLAFDVASSAMYELDTAPWEWQEMQVVSRPQYHQQTGRPWKSKHLTGFTVTIHPDPSMSGGGTCAVVWHVHHAIIDGFSRDLILHKLRRVIAGEQVLPSRSFLDLASKLHTYQRQHSYRARLFWEQQRVRFPAPASELLLAPPIVASASPQGTQQRITLPILFADVQATATSYGVTPAAMFQAAWMLTLAKFMDATSVVSAMIVSGRTAPLEHIEDTAGPMMNVLPFCAAIDERQSAHRFVQQIFRDMTAVRSFEWSRTNDGYERPLSTALCIDSAATPWSSRSSDRILEAPDVTIATEIPVYLFVRPDGIAELNFHPHRYRASNMYALGDIFRAAIDSLVAGRALGADRLPVEMRNRVLAYGNAHSPLTSSPSIDHDLVTLFERAARQWPLQPACRQGQESLTYAELDGQAAQVAAYLLPRVRAGDVVCLRPSRSFAWIVGIFGILKARAIYSALDGTLPARVQNDNFRTSTARILLTCDPDDDGPRPADCAILARIGDILATNPPEPASQHRAKPDPAANAYLCFTSGSTGKPKGVMCTHAGLVAFERNDTVRMFANPGRKIAQIMSPAFDGSIHEVFAALTAGATLCLPNSADSLDVLHTVDSALFTPSIAKVLDPADYPALRALYLVGEPVPQDVADRWGGHVELYNMYGPTEATCGATIKRLRPYEPVTLGSPQPSMRIYILDGRQALMPAGVIGEICLAGVQVSRGYIGRPELTERSFLSDPVCPDRGERIYRTGDLGYWNESGELVCLGRRDRQIKLLGFRLNLNDLECRIRRAIPRVTAVAIAQRGNILVAMVQPATLNLHSVRKQIASALPHYAQPRDIVAVDAFPMTKAGKLDYGAVAAAATATTAQTSTHAVPSLPSPEPSSAVTDCRMGALWRQALELPPATPIHGRSQFQELGGTSISQLRLMSLIRETYGTNVTLLQLLQHPILEDLVAALDTQPSPVAEDVPPLGPAGVTPMESDWFEKSRTGASSVNVSYACEIDPQVVDGAMLQAAWNVVLSRHQVLRSQFVEHDGAIVRQYFPTPPTVLIVDAGADINLEAEINRPFDLGTEHLIRVVLAPASILVIAHHIICDLVALRIMLREVAAHYAGEKLPAPVPFATTRAFSQPAPPDVLNFWSQTLNRPRTIAQLPADRITDDVGCSRVMRIPEEIAAALARFCARHRVTRHHVALAAVALVCSREGEDVDVVLGAPYMHRVDPSDMERVGLFLEPLPIRIQHHAPSAAADSLPSPPSSATGLPSSSSEPPPPPTTTTPGSFVAVVARSSQEALAHAAPWHQLQHLDPAGRALDAMVSFHEEEQLPSEPMRGLHARWTWTSGAKFKLLVEFMALAGDRLVLRLEHHTSSVPPPLAAAFEHAILAALAGLVCDPAPDVGLVQGNVARAFGRKDPPPAGPQRAPHACWDDDGHGAPLFGMRFDLL